MFRIDLHVHTSEVSPCGRVAAKDLVNAYKSIGYDAIVITDHFFEGLFDKFNDPWENKIKEFLKGYNTAKYYGEKFGLKVILGMEIRFVENQNDYLIFGFDEDFLYKNVNLYNIGLEDFRALTKKSGILIYQAHPFRNNIIPANPSLLDGIEVYNGNPRHNSNNYLAFEYAKENNLKMISGSDFHQIEDLGRGGIILNKPVSNSIELAYELLNDKNYELIK